MSDGEAYLAAAYVAVLVAVLVYLLIHTLRFARLEREVADLTERAAAREPTSAREEVSVGR